MGEMETIGLIAAMTEESNALLRYVKPWQKIRVGQLHGYSFEISGKNCVLVTSGMGVRRASEATRLLLNANAPQLLISFGIAGAVEEDLEIGDVVLSKGVCWLDQGIIGPILELEKWSEAAREAAAKELGRYGAHLLTGTAVTTSGSQALEYKLGEMRHPVLEMETAGIAQVAAERGVPLLSLRSISDGPRDPLPFDLGEVMDEDANLRTGKLLWAIVHNPRIILQSGRMMRNTRLAADHAAIALLAALNKASIGNIQGKLNE